jgi:hypothetical protein
MRSEYCSHNVLEGNINRWKNITADDYFVKMARPSEYGNIEII